MADSNKRENLYKQNPHCYWCGRKTYLVRKPEGCTEKELATVDHIKCRAEAESWQEYTSRENQVLACYLCNQQRNDAFLAKNPNSKQKWEVPPGTPLELLRREYARRKKLEKKAHKGNFLPRRTWYPEANMTFEEFMEKFPDQINVIAHGLKSLIVNAPEP